MTELRAEHITLSRPGMPVLNDISAAVRPGQLTALIGPNGAGKSSLLRVLTGQYRPDHGQVYLAGKPLAQFSAPERARHLAYLPQQRPLAWPSRVRDVVALGRFAYGAGAGRLSDTDRAAIDKAIADCALEPLAERRADSLSGGELARLHIARAFAAQTPLLLADEPIAALDPRHQLAVMALFRDYVKAGGGALIVLHDLNMARRFADHYLLMDQGRLVASGAPAQVITPQSLKTVFGVELRDGHEALDFDL